MLINCPRCGFQQPKDKYCAQCGVDIETFKPASPSFFKKVFGNVLTQLGLLVVVAGGVGVSLYQKGEQNLERRVGQMRSPVQIQSQPNLEENSASSEIPEPAAVAHAATEPESPNAINAYKVTPNEGVAATTPATEPSVTPASVDASDDKETRTVAKTTSPTVTVYYAEVGRNSLERMFNASRGTGQFMNFNEYSAGILPQIADKLKAQDITVLKKEIRPLESAKSTQWTYGLKDRMNPSVEIGLTTFIEVGDIDGGNLRGNLEIQRNWREPSPDGRLEPQRKSFPAIFEIGGQSGFFMAGVLPHRSPAENDPELTAIDVYKILRSPRFRTGESEFVIFVELTKEQ